MDMKLSMMTCGITARFGLERGYELLRETGFESVDWNLNDVLDSSAITKGTYRGNILEKSLEEMLAYFAPELEAQKKNGITIGQAHAPCPAYLPKDPELFSYMLGINENCVRLCGAVGCKYLVIHGIAGGATNEEIERLNWQMYTALIPALKETGVVVCLENLFDSVSRGSRGLVHTAGHCSDPHEAADLIDRLNEAAGQECFGLCLDTGHLNLIRVDPRVYIGLLGSRIKVLHVHDNYGALDQHLAPYNGNICWQHYWEALKKAGYRGDISFETFAQIVYIREDELIPSQLQAIRAVGQLLRDRILN
jgi:sugar phosphate isomerase/epimerase